MTGKLKANKYLVSCSQGSAVQIPSVRVRCAATGVTIALVRAKRSNMLKHMSRNSDSPERAELFRQLAQYNVSMTDMLAIIS